MGWAIDGPEQNLEPGQRAQSLEPLITNTIAIFLLAALAASACWRDKSTRCKVMRPRAGPRPDMGLLQFTDIPPYRPAFCRARLP